MKNKMKRMTALLLSIVMLLSSVVLSAAEEQEDNIITADTLGEELKRRYGDQMTDQEKKLLTSDILVQPNLNPEINTVSVNYETETVTANPYEDVDGFCWEPVSLTVDEKTIELDGNYSAKITIPFQTLEVQYQLTITSEQQDQYLQELKHLKEMLSYVEEAEKGAKVLQFLLDREVHVDLNDSNNNSLAKMYVNSTMDPTSTINKLPDLVQLKELWQKYCDGQVCSYPAYGTLDGTKNYVVGTKITDYGLEKKDAAPLAKTLVTAALEPDGLPSYCSYENVADAVNDRFGKKMRELYGLAVVAYDIDKKFNVGPVIDYQLKQKITSDQMNEVGATSTENRNVDNVYEQIIDKISPAATFDWNCFVPLADTTSLDQIVNAVPEPESLGQAKSTTDLYCTKAVIIDSEKGIRSWGSLLATLYGGNDAAKKILGSPALKTGYRVLRTPTDESLITVTGAGGQYTVTAQNFTDGDGLTWRPVAVAAKKDGNETATSEFKNNTATVSVSAENYDTMDVTYEVTLGYPDAIDAGAILALPQTLKNKTEEQLQVMEDMSGNGMVTNLEKVQGNFERIYNIVAQKDDDGIPRGNKKSIAALDEIRNECTHKGTYTKHDADGNVRIVEGKPDVSGTVDIFYLYDHVIAYREWETDAQRLAYYYAHSEEILAQLNILKENLPIIKNDSHVEDIILDLFKESDEIDDLINEFNDACEEIEKAAPSKYIDPEAENLEELAELVLNYPSGTYVPGGGDHLRLTAVISVEKSLKSICLEQEPTIVRYRKGEGKLDVIGGTITLQYQDGTSGVISLTGEMLSGFDPGRTGEQELTVTYLGKTCTFSGKITVVGDVNGTGLVDIRDMACLFTWLATGTNEGGLDETSFPVAADANGDGAVNILDYQAIYETIKK